MTELAPGTRARVLAALREQRVETASWAYANSGTRFKVFPQPGVPRTPEEKIDDAATVHRFTGVAPTVALHIPWDRVDDYGALARHARDRGVALGAINANVFQDNDYRLGSVTNPDPGVRRKAIGHLTGCVDIAAQTGSRDVKLWFSDGTNYPGQDDITDRQERLAVALRETYDRLGDDQRILLEYKLFEPAFYTMDVPDWGTAYLHCVQLGPKAQVVIDTGHHARCRCRCRAVVHGRGDHVTAGADLGRAAGAVGLGGGGRLVGQVEAGPQRLRPQQGGRDHADHRDGRRDQEDVPGRVSVRVAHDLLDRRR